MKGLKKTLSPLQTSPPSSLPLSLPLALPIVVFGITFLSPAVYAAEDIHDIIYYFEAIVEQGNVLYLQQNYSIVVDEVSISGDMVKLILKDGARMLMSDIYVSDTKEYTYSKTINEKSVDILDVNCFCVCFATKYI